MPPSRVWFGVLAAAVVLAAASVAASPARAQSPAPETEVRDQVVLSGEVSVRRGEEVGQVVVFRGRVSVAGVARGDVLVLSGRVEVTGQVSGSVVSLSGPVVLGPNAHVLGDVVARDRIRISGGAVVEGRVREGTAFTFRSPIDLFGPLATWFAVAVSTLALGALLLLLGPRASEAVAAAGVGSPLAAAGIGLAMAIAVPIVAVLAVASFVGLPFGLAVLLALWLALSVGFAWAVFALGRRLWGPRRSRWLALLIGWAAASAISAIPVVGGVVWVGGAVFGLGATAIAVRRAGARPTVRPGGRHRAGAKMPAPSEEPAPLVREVAMEQEGTGI